MEDEVPCIGAISSITQIANMKFSACILNNKMFLTTLTTLNTYNICAIKPGLIGGYPPSITFQSANGFPVPDRRYLALHAACAKAAFHSGVGEYFDNIERQVCYSLSGDNR
jgi:hypothetical protein